MKLNFSELKLNIIFYLIIIFSVILPVCISASLLFVNYKREIQISEESKKRIEQQVLLNLHLLLSSIKTEVNSVAQNPDIIELLNTKMEFRRFVENRVYGRLQEMSSKISVPIVWQLFNDTIQAPILSSSSKDSSSSSTKSNVGFSISTNNSDIILKNDIKLDDQNLSGPTSNLRGSLILNLSITEISKVVPGLVTIISLDKDASLQSLHVKIKKPESNQTLILISILILGFILLFSIFSGLFLMRTYILKPIDKISNKLSIEGQSSLDIQKNKNELQVLENAINSYVEQLKTIEKERADKTRIEAISSITRQVAHDIRSPLSALNLVSGALTEVSEEKRLLIRNAVQRINDIANQLLEKGKITTTTNTKTEFTQNSLEENKLLTNELLSPLIDSIVSEKRVQFREKQNVEIEADINQGYGLFAKVNTIELKRMISNLLNNSIEALVQSKGSVKVAIRGYRDTVSLIIQDNGSGIPASLLKNLGDEGFSHGKTNSDSGSGLGIYHAKKTTESFGGKFEILSKEGLGTTITIHLPRTQAPNWFVQKIILKSKLQIISLDDDLAIHQIWKGRLQSFVSKMIYKIEHITFTSGDEFKHWVLSQKPVNNIDTPYLYLIDYELLGQNKSGLDFIEELQIAKNSILVTSRYEEISLRERCAILGVQIIPKTMAGFVPIEMESQESPDSIQI